MISQIFVLGPRGDNLIFRDFKSDIPKVGTGVTHLGLPSPPVCPHSTPYTQGVLLRKLAY